MTEGMGHSSTSTSVDRTSPGLSCLHVNAGGSRLSVAFDVVEEFAEIGPWAPVAGAADWCRGLVQWRGRLLTMVDGGRLFGSRPSANGHQVVLSGLAVEAVLAVDSLVGVFSQDEPADVHLDLKTLRSHAAFAPGAAGGVTER